MLNRIKSFYWEFRFISLHDASWQAVLYCTVHVLRIQIPVQNTHLNITHKIVIIIINKRTENAISYSLFSFCGCLTNKTTEQQSVSARTLKVSSLSLSSTTNTKNSAFRSTSRYILYWQNAKESIKNGVNIIIEHRRCERTSWQQLLHQNTHHILHAAQYAMQTMLVLLLLFFFSLV